MNNDDTLDKLRNMLCRREDKTSLQFFPRAELTYEICLDFVKRDPWNLPFVPKDFLTYEICLEAIKQNGSALQYVPREFVGSLFVFF